MKQTCSIFVTSESVRDASVNIYRGSDKTFTHIVGFPHTDHAAAVRTAQNRGETIYRINVRMKPHETLCEKAISDVQSRPERRPADSPEV
ncbi:hypothetical protein EVB39_065 [Rhizobium phage RHph_TM3_3_9]|nr:hypothetical protein EVB39_065 [Rhizobium phage RHph_TM3_3_9]QIG68586.1 hypothetical protein EVB66_065 [Rhizobium phage RHph_TM3_3_13]QIG74444.1 hypothetical protein EVC09_064 [Rhizobium phage RHph_TM3_3_10]QXV74558.1 hypothetical protein [Rhizobium phage RHEph19]